MLNLHEINLKEINFIEQFEELENIIYSSFASEIGGKFAYLGELGHIFNFNSLCQGQMYGNAMLSQNFLDIPDIDVFQYDSPLQNGGIIEGKRFTEKIFNIKILVTCDTIEHLEKELQTMKSIFNGKGKLYKKEYNRESIIDVELTDFKVGPVLLIGTEINLTFLSRNPFWSEITGVTRFFENQDTPLNGTLNISDSDYSVELITMIQILDIKENENKTSLDLILNGYKVQIETEVKEGDIIIFDGVKKEVFINGNKVFYRGQFALFPINIPSELKFNYPDESIERYNLYILYDKIVL